MVHTLYFRSYPRSTVVGCPTVTVVTYLQLRAVARPPTQETIAAGA